MNKNYCTLLLLLIAVSGFAQNTRIQAVENGLTETRDLVFEDSLIPKYNILERMELYKVPSISIAVINNGKIEWAKAYGFADVAGRRAANIHTRYQVASISKSVNGLAIMRLAEQGQLSLDRDIRTYLKTWSFPENAHSQGNPITLKHLLSHTAGLNVHGFVGYPRTDAIPDINQILDGKAPANNEAIRPIMAPGKQFEYSGGGTTIIRKILDDHISANYDSLMQALLLKPLRMKHSSFSQPLDPRIRNYAYGYDQAMQVLKGEYYLYPEQAPGGLWSNASDIARFVIAVQQACNGKTNAFIRQNTAVEMLTPVLDHYALGFGIEERGGEKYFRHDGENFGYNALYYGSFSTGKGVVILSNGYPENARPLLYEILHSVADAYAWKDFYQPVRKKLIALPDATLLRYVGDYYSENPPVKISISKNDQGLVLTARRPEPLYAIGPDTFFIPSSPNDNCVFSSSGNEGAIDTFVVMQGDKIIIKALRKE
jgi:CubicO group peptidase (beta-lactamase class C family)